MRSRLGLVAALFVACAEPKTPLPAGSAPRHGPALAQRSDQARAEQPSYVEALRARLGGNVTLTLEPHLQSVAERVILRTGRAAAVVALTPSTGEILAVFSVVGDRGDPLLVAHSPTSTIKPLVALAALESGALLANTAKACSGSYEFAGQHLTCHGEHGRQDAGKAIATSCNAFYYEVGAQVEPARLMAMARRFGYGSRTGVELADEPGFVPEPSTLSGAGPLVEAIGHGQLKVTLLQLARAYAALANGATLPPLTLIRTSAGAVERRARIEVQPSHLALVRSGLFDAVNAEYGTAHSVAIASFRFAGKTGSADAPPLPGAAPQAEPDADGWFVAYAPATAPELLLAARVERGGNARAVVRAMLDAWRARP